jgi:hypothetical protein
VLPNGQLGQLIALLRRCPAVTDNGRVAERTPPPLPGTEAEWHVLLDLAAGQGVGPLLADELLRVHAAMLPPTVVERLRGMQAAATQRALLQLGELLRVQARLQSAGIPMLFFKGQMLAHQAYGAVNLRSCFDLDLFVPEAQVLRAKRVFAELGYRPEFNFLPHQEADLLRMECEYTFIREDNAARIDLQWRPRARHFVFPVPPEALWARHQTVTLNGFPVATFFLPDLVVVLISHGAKHTWNRLELACSLAALLHRNPAFDWAGPHQLMASAGAERMLLLAAQLVNEHFGVPLPAALTERIVVDNAVAALAAECASRWAAPPEPQPLLRTLRRHLQMRERLRDRMRHCFWLAVTPTPQDWLACPLPRHWHWVHYLRRPVRLLAKHGG